MCGIRERAGIVAVADCMGGVSNCPCTHRSAWPRSSRTSAGGSGRRPDSCRGGLKEAAQRAYKEAKGNDILQFLKTGFTNAATANVSKSALEAKKMGYLKEDDVIVFNAYELLHVAKVEARAMFDAGYRPRPR